MLHSFIVCSFVERLRQTFSIPSAPSSHICCVYCKSQLDSRLEPSLSWRRPSFKLQTKYTGQWYHQVRSTAGAQQVGTAVVTAVPALRTSCSASYRDKELENQITEPGQELQLIALVAALPYDRYRPGRPGPRPFCGRMPQTAVQDATGKTQTKVHVATAASCSPPMKTL